MKKCKWLSYDLLENIPGLCHGTFLRNGGVSKEPFDSLNVSNSVGDHPQAVLGNRGIIQQQLGLSHLVFPQQEHGIGICRVTANNVGDHFIADGLITNEPGIGLGATHADCQIALFYDPVQRAIGIAHSGWRGSVQNVYSHLIETLHREMNSQPRDLLVAISPSLGPDHAEFKNYCTELPETFWDAQVSPNYFDFWEISRRQLLKAGVQESHIEVASLCTHCEAEDYYSSRRDKKTGRNGTVIGLIA